MGLPPLALREPQHERPRTGEGAPHCAPRDGFMLRQRRTFSTAYAQAHLRHFQPDRRVGNDGFRGVGMRGGGLRQGGVGLGKGVGLKGSDRFLAGHRNGKEVRGGFVGDGLL